MAGGNRRFDQAMAMYDAAAQFVPPDPLAPSDPLASPGWLVQAPMLRPEMMDKPQWWKDPKLDWDTVPMGQVHKFEIPKALRDERDRGLSTFDAELFKRYNDYLQMLIEENGLQPGDGFTLEGKIYQYLGPQDDPMVYGPGHNFIPKPPSPSPEVG